MNKEEIIIQNIIEAGKKLFQQFGLKKTTMEDIAKAAGKGKSTLYYYFKNKEEIIDEVIKQEMNDFFYGVKKAVEKEEDPFDKLKTYIVVKTKTLKHKANLYRFAIETEGEEDINIQFKKLRERYDHEEIALIVSIIHLGIEKGKFKLLEGIEVETMAQLLLICVRGIELEVVVKGKYGKLADKADLLVDILTKAISA